MCDKTNKDVLIFIDHICEIIKYFLRERHAIHLKKETLHLTGLIYNLQTQRGEPVHERLNDSLLNLQGQFFPIKSRDLPKNSNEATNFNLIVESFLNLLVLSKNLKVLPTPYIIIPYSMLNNTLYVVLGFEDALPNNQGAQDFIRIQPQKDNQHHNHLVNQQNASSPV